MCLLSDALLLGFLLPWTWGIFFFIMCLFVCLFVCLQLFQQNAAALPYLARGVSPHDAHADPEHDVAPFGPPSTAQPPLLGRGLLFSAAAPDLRLW